MEFETTPIQNETWTDFAALFRAVVETAPINGVITINLVSGVTDYASIINEALRMTGVTEVRLGVGTFPLGSPVSLPSGAHLTGAGAELTVLQALPDFNTSGPLAVIVSEFRAGDITLSNFAVEGGKLSPGGLRLNGVFMDEVVGFDITRVDVYNTTGYAHFARGDVNGLVGGSPNPVGTSGTYTECNTYNAQVHYEVMMGENVTYTNVTASDGDGDISTEAYFHPLLGSRNITYIGASAIGDGLIGFSLISSIRSMENIRIINSYVDIDRPASGYGILDHSGLPTLNLQIENSTFISREYIGFSATGITGSATNSTFLGGVIGINIEDLIDTASDFEIADSYALALADPNNLAGIVGIQAVAGVTFTGGTIEARGSGGLMFPYSGGVQVSPETTMIQNGFDTRVDFGSASGLALLFPLVTLPETPFGSFDGGLIKIRFRSAYVASDEINITNNNGISINGDEISYGGVTIGVVVQAMSGIGFTILLNEMANVESVNAIIQNINYSAGEQGPGELSRFIEVIVSDGSGVFARLNAAVHTGDIQGGLADDLYIVASPDTTILETSGYGVDEVRTGLTSYILPDNVENLTATGSEASIHFGNDLSNLLTGHDGINMLLGEGGDDYLLGLMGNDFLDGGDGNDVLEGGVGDDKQTGRDGDDILTGGAGADRLTGGEGADTFRYLSASDSSILGLDWITDFETGDVIDLSAIDADPFAEGDQAFAFIGNDVFGEVGGQLRAFQLLTGRWIVEGDVNGDGLADFAIQLSSSAANGMTASDFML